MLLRSISGSGYLPEVVAPEKYTPHTAIFPFPRDGERVFKGFVNRVIPRWMSWGGKKERVFRRRDGIMLFFCLFTFHVYEKFNDGNLPFASRRGDVGVISGKSTKGVEVPSHTFSAFPQFRRTNRERIKQPSDSGDPSSPFCFGFGKPEGNNYLRTGDA